MGGQIVHATIVAAPKQRNTEAERAAIKAGQIPEGWAEKPAKLRRKDRDARWTVKFSKARPREDGAPQVDLAVPAFGYKNHVSIDRAHGLIRGWAATHAAAHDGARLEAVLDRENTASDVWADTAYRSAKNEAMLASRGLVSRIHRKKPQGRPMPERTRRANARKSAVRSRVEHVFAHQKGIMGLMVRTIGIARAEVKIGLANLAYKLGDIEQVPLADASVDLAILSQALHHARHPQKAVDEAWRILRPGGQLVVLDLNEHTFAKARELYADRWLGFKESALHGFLRKAGFAKVEVTAVAREEIEPCFETLLACGFKERRG